MSTNVKEIAQKLEKPEQNAEKEELKTCFIVMPISNADGYEMGHFNRVYDYIIKPACKAAGFEPSRADDTKHTNTIILDILNQIVQADMVICDLSSKNPNVMYELGIRQAFNLPVVLIKDTLTQRVFDTSSLRDIEYDHSLRIDNVNSTVRKVTEALKSTYEMKDKDTHSLISLLNIQPANLPERKELSPEISLVLDEIRSLKESRRNEYVTKQKNYLEMSLLNLEEYVTEEEKKEIFSELKKGTILRHKHYGEVKFFKYDHSSHSILIEAEDFIEVIEYPYTGILSIAMTDLK